MSRRSPSPDPSRNGSPHRSAARIRKGATWCERIRSTSPSNSRCGSPRVSGVRIRKGATWVERLRPDADPATSAQASVCGSDVNSVVPSTIKVTIVKARGLRNADTGMSQAVSDPYCVCEIPDRPRQRFQTKVVQDTLDPVWNHEVTLYNMSLDDSLSFSIWDKDVGKEDDLLGTAELPSNRFQPQGFEGELWLENAGKGIQAFLTVKVVVMDNGPPILRPFPAPPMVRLPAAITTLQAELAEARRQFHGVCQVDLVDDDVFEWEVAIPGLEATPYRGGTFWFRLTFPPGYPAEAPHVRCLTPVFHCNIDQNGTVCTGSLSDAGHESAEISPGGGCAIYAIKALLSILFFPVPENAIVPSAAGMYLSDRRQHDRVAREWTQRYAL